MKNTITTFGKVGLVLAGFVLMSAFSVFAQDVPTSSAPTPTLENARVISIFSDAYPDVPRTDFNPNWGQNTVVTIENIAEGDEVLKYATLNYQGTQFATPLNLSKVQTLHLDVWSATATTFNFFLISPGPKETPYPITTTAGEWVSLDIPLTSFVTEATPVDLSTVIQFKVDDNGSGVSPTIFFDNIYFVADAVVGPLTAAPVPVFDTTKVRSFFSDAPGFGNWEGVNYNPDWGQATKVSFVKFSDTDSAIKYENLNYQGTDFDGNRLTAAGMTHIHIDMWTNDASPVNFSLISPGPKEFPAKMDSTKGVWVGYDIPLTAFPGVDLTDIFQFKFDNANSGVSPTIYLDNIYFYNAAVNDNPAEPVANVSLINANKVNTISWSATENAFRYKVYFSEAPFDSVNQDGVILLTETRDLSFTHELIAPHPSLANGLTLYYAVTSVNEVSVETKDISKSYESVTGSFKSSPFLKEVDADAAEIILGNLSEGIVSNAGFPEDLEPFVVGHLSNQGELLTLPTDAADLTAKFWGVFFEDETNGSFIVLYVEIMDDVQEFTVADNLLSTWGYDGIEYAFGGYQVSSFIKASDHQDMERGDEPDYQFRAGQFTDRGNPFLYENFRFATEVPNSLTLSDDLIVDGNKVGYRMMIGINMEQLQGGDGSDKLIDLPNGTELFLMPAIFVAVDADGEGRESQMVSSTMPNLSNQWWNTPAEWNAVAYAGKDVVVTSTEEVRNQVAGKFTLSQNYPNPFNPSTTINFSIPTAENVTLEVYNMLGQRVATLVNTAMSAGSHSVKFDASGLASGLYLYKVTAGSFTASKKMALIK